MTDFAQKCPLFDTLTPDYWLKFNAAGTKIVSTGIIALNGDLEYKIPVAVDQASIVAAIASITGNGTVFIPPGDFTISTPLTIPSNITFIMSKGATLKKSGSGTVTCNGIFKADLDQVLSGFSSGNVSFVNNRQPVYMDWFGSNETAFANAVAATQAYGKMIMSPKAYTFSTGVEVDKNISLWMEPPGYIYFTGTGIALHFTAALGQNDMRVSVQNDVTSWTAGDVGVQFDNIAYCNVYFGEMKGFEKGIYIYDTGAVGNGTFFNNFYLDRITYNKYGLYLHGDSPGYVNGNKFWGGAFLVTEDIGVTSEDRYGIFCEDVGVNVFMSPGIQIDGGTGGGIGYQTYFKGNSKWNRVVEPYSETLFGTGYVMGAEGTARFNKVIGHYTDGVGASINTKINEIAGLSYPGTNTIDWAIMDNVSLSKGGLHTIFKLNNVIERAVANTTSPRYIISGFTWLASNGTYQLERTATGLYLSDIYLGLEANAAIGRWVDTNYVKNFWLHLKMHSGTAYVIVKCYDGDGALLSAGTHVQGLSNNTDDATAFTTTASWGAGYILTSVTDMAYFNVASTVKSIWVGITTNTTAGLISMSLSTNETIPPTSPGYNLVTNGAYNDTDTQELGCTGAPIGGVFNNGTVIRHLDVATAENPAWFVTGRTSTNANGGEPAGEVNLVVDSITGTVNGDILGVMLTKDTSLLKQWHWTTINGIPSGSTLVMADAVPTGYTIADNARVITYRLLAQTVLP